MCLIALALDHHPRFPLVVAANRDEFFERPTAPLAWWGTPPVLAGRDLQAGGTWFGLTRAGRLAMVTNIRRPDDVRPDAPSRGRLVQQWLRGDLAPEAFCEQARSARPNPFNLLAADLARGQVFFTSTDQPDPRVVPAGVHGLSNATLDTPWPKVVDLKARLDTALDEADDAGALTERMLAALADRRRPSDDALPDTGIGRAEERALASAFIDVTDIGYGTRCSTVLVVEATAAGPRAQVVEQGFTPDGAPAGRRVEHLPQWPPTRGGSPARPDPEPRRQVSR